MIDSAILKAASGEDPSAEETLAAFTSIMLGAAEPMKVAALLTALKMKGPSPGEVIGAARAMRSACIKVDAPEGAVDIVGTGGDGYGTFNISTTAAFIAAGAGVTVAKHGNRASTSKSGAADVLAALGVNIEADAATVEECLRTAGIGFLFSNKLHPAMKYAAQVRRALPFRTIFNILGPLTNPSGARRCALGVYSRDVLELYLNALESLGTDHALVFSGPGGLDEIGLGGETVVAELWPGTPPRRYAFDPARMFGRLYPVEDLKGGTPQENALITEKILCGEEQGPKRMAACINAAAAIVAAGLAPGLEDGYGIACAAIDNGGAMARLEALRKCSNG